MRDFHSLLIIIYSFAVISHTLVPIIEIAPFYSK